MIMIMIIIILVIGTIFSVNIMRKAIGEYRWYHPQEDDEEIVGKVLYVETFAFRMYMLIPIVLYYVDKEEQRYKFRFPVDAYSNYYVGEEVILHLSKRNGRVYYKKDLKKGLIYSIAVATFFVVADIGVILYLLTVSSFTMK